MVVLRRREERLLVFADDGMMNTKCRFLDIFCPRFALFCFFSRVLILLCVFTFLCVFQYYSRYTKEAHAHAYCLEFISLSLSLFVCKSDYIITLVCLVFHARTTNLVVKDSRCRGGIVNILGGCSRALTIRWLHPKAL